MGFSNEMKGAAAQFCRSSQDVIYESASSRSPYRETKIKGYPAQMQGKGLKGCNES